MTHPFRLALAVVAALLLTANLSFAQKKPPVPTAIGVVKTVDVTAGTITLAGKKMKGGGESPDQVVTIAKDAKVTIDGEAKKLADIKEGGHAVLQLDADKKTATAVSIHGETVTGVVKAVDATANTITLAAVKKKNTEGEDRVIPVAKTAKIMIEGEPKKLADVKAGVQAHLALTVDAKSALVVIVGGKKKSGPPTVGGLVKVVDEKSNTITLAGGKTKKGGEFPEQVITIAKDAKVTVGGEAKALSDVKAGDAVTLTLDDKKSAVAVTVGGKKKKPE